MIELRRADSRGHADHDWLDTWHSFSFAQYYDPQRMGFRSLRVINEDRIAGGGGFPMHAHNNMEILTYVVTGALEHKDSMGNGSVIRAGDVQYMSAGSGVAHSEFNHSRSEVAHLLQIWIVPNVRDAEPRYGQVSITSDAKQNTLKLIASGEADAPIQLRQDTRLYACILGADESVAHAIQPGRGAWLQIITGKLEVNTLLAQAGDAIVAEHIPCLKIRAQEKSEFILFNLA
jgi:redox-sensitive bicupin YhaK (pirin superfamily)